MYQFPQIFPVTCHTGFVGHGSTFVAIKGATLDGVQYIAHALERGATKIVIEHNAHISLDDQKKIDERNVVVQRVENARKALAILAAEALHYPAKHLKIIGITGTKGKTTTAFLIEHILRTAGYKVGLLSTVGHKIDGIKIGKNLTTPQPDYVHMFFAESLRLGVEYVVMEVSAQALSLDRVYGIEFDGAIFTNFSQEHAEFYSSLSDYFNAKCLLFKQLKLNAPCIINADDAWYDQIKEQTNDITCIDISLYQSDFKFSRTSKPAHAKLVEVHEHCARAPQQVPDFPKALTSRQGERHSVCELVLVGKSKPVSVKIIKNSFHEGLSIQLEEKNKKYKISCPNLVGTFNVYNVAMAATLLNSLGISYEQSKDALCSFGAVPGRMQRSVLPNKAIALIDYAHTASSFEAFFVTVRPFTKHLIVVFGAGGNRDKTKRPEMGRIAAQYADVIVLTTDNPRTEYAVDIVHDIMLGIPCAAQQKVIVELDREQAIKKAYQLSTEQTIIALLGKGPDEYQEVAGIKIPFSEHSILQSL